MWEETKKKLEEEMIPLLGKIVELGMERDKLKKENDELKEARTRTREKFNALYGETFQSLQKNRDLEVLLADCRRHSDQQRESIMNHRTENEDLRDRLRNSGTNILNLSNKLLERMKVINTQAELLQKLTNDNNDMRKKLEDANENVIYLRDKVKILQEVHHACLHRYDKLNEKGEINMPQIEELETKIAKLERQVEIRNKTLRDVVEAHREFRAELQDMIEEDNEVYRFFNERFAKLSGFAATRNSVD